MLCLRRLDLRDDGEEQLAQLHVVLVEDGYHLFMGDGWRSLDADVVVGDHGDVRVAELELAAEVPLRIGGHVDDVPACSLEPFRLGPCGKARSLDDDDRAAVAGVDPELVRGLDEEVPQVWAIRVGRGNVGRLGPVVERVRPAIRPFDELVADDELAEREIGPERPGCVWADDPPNAELLHRPDVCPVRNLVRRELVPGPVAREERDPLAADLADGERRRRLAERRLDLDLLDVLEERVEPRAPEDAYVSRGHLVTLAATSWCLAPGRVSSRRVDLRSASRRPETKALL